VSKLYIIFLGVSSYFNSNTSCVLSDGQGNVYSVASLIDSTHRRFVAKWDGGIWTELGGVNSTSFSFGEHTLSLGMDGSVFAIGKLGYTSKMFVAKYGVNTAIENADLHPTLSYPNPVDDMLYINWGDEQKGVFIRILGSDGSIKCGKYELKLQSETIDMSSYPSGIYFLEITSKGSTLTRKVIKQ